MPDIIYDKYPVVALDMFLPEVMLEIPELPEDIAMHYVREAAIEFATRAHVLERTVTICKQDCVQDYILEPPDCTRLVAVQHICSEGCCGGPVTRLSTRPCALSCGTAYSWFEEPNIIHITGGASRYNVRISVAPRRDACELPEKLYERYKPDVQAGAFAKLYGVPRRAWSSQGLADDRRAEFDRRIASAGIDRLMGHQQGPIKMKTRRVL